MKRLLVFGLGATLLASTAATAQQMVNGQPIDDIVAGNDASEEDKNDPWAKAVKANPLKGPDRRALNVYFRNNLDKALKQCARAALDAQEEELKDASREEQEAKAINGKIELRFIIQKDGSVTDFKRHKNTTPKPSIADCMERVIKRADFPALKSSDLVYYTYTFNLKTDLVDSFPLRFNTGINNSFGSGVFGAGYTNAPSWNTSIPLSMAMFIPRFNEYIPGLILSAGTGVSVQWISNYQVGSFVRIPRVGDFNVGLGFGNLFEDPLIDDKDWSKLNVTGRISVRAPLSLASRTQNVIAGAGAGLNFAYELSNLPGLKDIKGDVGSFTISYSPRVGGTWYSQTSGSIPCDVPPDFDAALQGTGDPVQNIDLPSRIPRAREVLPNGECRLVGRQSLFGVGQGISLLWNKRKHFVSAGVGITHSFLRPLNKGGNVSSEFITGQNFNESTNGSLSYTYVLPMKWAELGRRFKPRSNITVGLSSFQPIYTFDGKQLRFPFWDFVSPQNQFSSAFVNLGINF